VPGPGKRITVDALLEEARADLARLAPHEALDALQAGSVLVDIRSESQRARDGEVPGAAFVPRNVLEWRCDPGSPHRDPDLARRDRTLIVICDDGYQSSRGREPEAVRPRRDRSHRRLSGVACRRTPGRAPELGTRVRRPPQVRIQELLRRAPRRVVHLEPGRNQLEVR
jgi:rhodanese-related sulfurtransferase